MDLTKNIDLANAIKLSYLKSPVLTSSLFNQVIDLIIGLIRDSNHDHSGGGGSGKMTPEEIRDALQTLINAQRLNASAIHDLATNVIFTNPVTNVSANIITIVNDIIGLINNFIPVEDGDGLKFLNDQGEYIRIDWNSIINRPTNTSDFVNDGEDGSSPFITVDNAEVIILNKIKPETGVVEGMEISNNVTLVEITAGSFVINNYSTNVIDYVNSTAFDISLSAFNLSKTYAWIGLTKSKTIVISYQEFSEIQRRSIAAIGYVEYSSTSFSFVKSIRPNTKATLHQLHDLMMIFGNKSISGNKIESLSGLKLNKSLGTYFGSGINGSNPLEPNKLFSDQQSNITFNYIYGNYRNIVISSNDVLTTFLGNGGNLNEFEDEKFGFTRFSMSVSGKWFAELSNEQYETLLDAKNAALNFDKILDKPIILHTFYAAYQKNVQNINDGVADQLMELFDDTGSSISDLSITYQQVIDALDYVPEDEANKVTNFNNPNNTTYPTTLAVVNKINEEIENRPRRFIRFDFANQANLSISHTLKLPVKASIFINDKEALATIQYVDQIVNVMMSKPKTGYVIVESCG